LFWPPTALIDLNLWCMTSVGGLLETREEFVSVLTSIVVFTFDPFDWLVVAVAVDGKNDPFVFTLFPYLLYEVYV